GLQVRDQPLVHQAHEGLGPLRPRREGRDLRDEARPQARGRPAERGTQGPDRHRRPRDPRDPAPVPRDGDPHRPRRPPRPVRRPLPSHQIPPIADIPVQHGYDELTNMAYVNVWHLNSGPVSGPSELTVTLGGGSLSDTLDRGKAQQWWRFYPQPPLPILWRIQ